MGVLRKQDKDSSLVKIVPQLPGCDRLCPVRREVGKPPPALLDGHTLPQQKGRKFVKAASLGKCLPYRPAQLRLVRFKLGGLGRLSGGFSGGVLFIKGKLPFLCRPVFPFRYLEETYGLTSERKIADAADLAAHQNSYHPVRDYLNGLVWDGTERICFCLRHFLGAAADTYTCEALKLFLLGAIHRAYRPGCKFEVMLCLVGGQGAGKSTFFRLLAVRDEWFSDDLRRLDDDNVYRKLQGHWIIEMSEMIATANAKSIEEIKSFLSRQKEVYKIPYETHPADRPRQCVFGGTSNALDFLPLDRSGNRRFLPVLVNPEQAEVHILEDEAASRAYISQLWAEAMVLYRAGRWKLTFSPELVRYLKDHQRDFMPEDTKAGMILAYLDRCTGDAVCSKQLYREALNHPFDEPKQWEIREINEIMNQCVTGWSYFSNPRMFPQYGRQKGWERENATTDTGNEDEKIPDGFVSVTEQMELPF